MKFRKIRRIMKTPLPEKTKKQLEANRDAGIRTSMLYPDSLKEARLSSNSPKAIAKRMKSPAVQKNLFKPGNQIGKLRDKRNMSEEEKMRMSIRMTGKKLSEDTKAKISMSLLGRIFSEETRKKLGEAKRKKLDKETLELLISYFKNGMSLTELSKELKVDRIVLGKILRRNGINFDAKERNSLSGKNNPNVKRTQFKKGQNLGNKNGNRFTKGNKFEFKKGNVPWNKGRKEVKNEANNNTYIAPASFIN
jgi:hypothetical protein